MSDDETNAAAPHRRFQLGRRAEAAAAADARRRVAAWVRSRFELSCEDTVLVTEVACGSPGCPPIETVVAFWPGGAERRQFKVFKGAADVREEDVPPRWMKQALVFREGEGLDCC